MKIPSTEHGGYNKFTKNMVSNGNFKLMEKRKGVHSFFQKIQKKRSEKK